ncbi:MAG: beta-hexosaminidase [Flintibacter sp.]|uniref:glycoside hydrolase family 3 protein n=1 Tax=Flintibacter sp. TaxID=1918624 RepID=UPI00267323D3|nr:glycoside hydrolase family 3 N-terminal domain-containing protein [Flintibacter sp.]MCI6149699.1 beta-hexosaminidase [Flintibacter sp.]MDD7115523.1 glycoside hydrolase family 3 N-terminal domain-containing protein [Flintibacter sp.]MDY5037359.1 glycoside hydrolase family 3 N-terminal domain-containing protein [Lawsonibacter sp.]
MKKALIVFLCVLLTGCAPTSGTSAQSTGSQSTPQDSSVQSSDSSSQDSSSGAPDASQDSEEPPSRPDPSVTSGSTENQDQIIEELLSTMTVEEKVGQMFFVRCPDTGAVEAVSQYKLGGYILFGRDFKDKTAEQVRNDISSYQSASGVPLLIGTDEEGGTVVRASSNPNLFSHRGLSPQALFAEGGMDSIIQDARQKSVTLLGLGVNVNLAPVADVSTDPNDFIYDRSFGQDAQATAEYVSNVVKTMDAEGIGSVLKHFPGYGNNVDTHTGVAIDERPYETFQTSDYLPFTAGIQAGADAVLVSHNVMSCVDNQLPASLSPAVHNELRSTLGFQGVIMTDDLAMDAVAAYAGDQSPAVMAVKAGNDMIITTDFQTQIPEVVQAVKSGEIDEAQIDQSVTRVLQWKYDLGLLGN